LISNFRRVINVVCFLLGNSLASEIYMPTFRNNLFHLHRHTPTCETSAYKLQTPGNYPKENIQKKKILVYKEHPKICIGRIARKPTLDFVMSACQFARQRKTAGFPVDRLSRYFVLRKFVRIPSRKFKLL
jgi:hypothetical protein